jgi:acyl carrier protein
MSADSIPTLTRTEVLAVVLAAAADALEPDSELEPSQFSEDTTLVGAGAIVDSLGLVQILNDVEETISDQYGEPINLTDARALSQKNSPFRTIGTLVDHVMSRTGRRAARE